MSTIVSALNAHRSPNSLAGLIFDLDGTLIDTAADLAASMNHVLHQQGLEAIPTAKVRHLVGYGARAMIRAGFTLSAKAEPTNEELTHMVEDFVTYYATHSTEQSRPFPGVIKALEEFQAAGIRLSICTNKSEALAVPLIDALGIGHYFDLIVGGDTAGVAKPDPAPVHLCLSAMGISPETARKAVLFVGDSDTDILAAQSCDLRCVICTFGYGPLTNQHKITATLDDYKKAPTLFYEVLAHKNT